ncbi:unnamed protein product, partial [Phaeothamnion confervicola]
GDSGSGQSPRELLALPAFWHLSACFVASAVGGLLVAGTFKSLAQRAFHSDRFLVIAASLASVSNAAGRLAWGNVLDRFGYANALVCLNAGQAFLLGTYDRVVVAGSAPGFLLWTCLIFGFYGGNFAIFPAATAQLFGNAHAGTQT